MISVSDDSGLISLESWCQFAKVALVSETPGQLGCNCNWCQEWDTLILNLCLTIDDWHLNGFEFFWNAWPIFVLDVGYSDKFVSQTIDINLVGWSHDAISEVMPGQFWLQHCNWCQKLDTRILKSLKLVSQTIDIDIVWVIPCQLSFVCKRLTIGCNCNWCQKCYLISDELSVSDDSILISGWSQTPGIVLWYWDWNDQTMQRL